MNQYRIIISKEFSVYVHADGYNTREAGRHFVYTFYRNSTRGTGMTITTATFSDVIGVMPV